MRHRIGTNGRTCSMVAALATAALLSALPASSDGARLRQAPLVPGDLIETLDVDASASTPEVGNAVLKGGTEYILVVDGVVSTPNPSTYDALYCFEGEGCDPPYQSGSLLKIGIDTPSNPINSTSKRPVPGYNSSNNHRYTVDYTPGGDGHLAAANNYAQEGGYIGHFHISVYTAGLGCQATFRFTSSNKHRGRVRAVKTGGAGTFTFAQTEGSGRCSGTLEHGTPSAGAKVFHVDVPNLDLFPGDPELKLTIKPESAVYTPRGRGQSFLRMEGSVVKTNDPDCRSSSDVQVTISDGAGHGPDGVRFSSRDCRALQETFKSSDPHRVAVKVSRPKAG